ncbi:MAG TPA: hypothetical protein VGI34_00635 [Candidatus Acidoferrales bacterium]
MRHLAALGAYGIALSSWFGAPLALAQAGGSQGATVAENPAPSPERIHAMIAKAIENQHRDDQALQEFERVEHKVIRNGENAEVTIDISERILPTATGNIKLKITDKGVPVPPETYRTELEFAVNAFNLAMHPNERYKEDVARFQRRQREHSDLVDTSAKALLVTWVGRETRADSADPQRTRTFLKFLLDSDPSYKPINSFATVFQHVHATLWVDEEQLQFARLEGDVTSDIPFAGGIGGKVYRGGHVVLVQEEVAPDIWLPTLLTFDLDGRKFVFPFGMHERTEMKRYRRIGPPAQAIEIVRNDLNNPSTVAPTR